MSSRNLTNFLDLVTLMGHPQFDSSLLACLAEWVQTKHFSIYRVQDQSPALLLCGTYNDHHSIPLRCGQSYVQRFHAYDDLYQKFSESRTSAASNPDWAGVCG